MQAAARTHFAVEVTPDVYGALVILILKRLMVHEQQLILKLNHYFPWFAEQDIQSFSNLSSL